MSRGAFAVPFALLFAMLSVGPAWAAHWNVDYSRSRLGFEVQWSNEPFRATFKRWNADIDFDLGDLAHSRAAVTVDLTSETSTEPDFDSGLKGAEGFATPHFPAAHFVVDNFVRTNANAFVARGSLALHGIAREITLPFNLTITGRAAHMTGTAHVLRTDFRLGQGQWADSNPVSRDVTITVDLTAAQQ